MLKDLIKEIDREGINLSFIRELADIAKWIVLEYYWLKPDDYEFFMIDKTAEDCRDGMNLLLVIRNNRTKPFHAFDVIWEFSDEGVFDIHRINGETYQEVTSFNVPPSNSEEFKIEMNVKSRDNKESSPIEVITKQTEKSYILKINYCYYGFWKMKIDTEKRFNITKSVMKFLESHRNLTEN